MSALSGSPTPRSGRREGTALRGCAPSRLQGVRDSGNKATQCTAASSLNPYQALTYRGDTQDEGLSMEEGAWHAPQDSH